MTRARIGGGILVLLSFQVLALFALGQPPICECGFVELWHGAVLSNGNSQHLTDWYTLSHVIHGILFYALLVVIFPRMSLRARLFLALGIEVGWEVIENTPFVIDRYRETALALGYSGDSIINSLSDSFAMLLGFFVARKAPIMVTALSALALEAFSMYMIRDGLLLNVINLLHSFPALQAWQAGM